MKLSGLYKLQSNKQATKDAWGREEKMENIGDIGRWFHYQLQDAYDVHGNSEEGLQNMDLNRFISA